MATVNGSRTRPSGSAQGEPPSRNLGVGGNPSAVVGGAAIRKTGRRSFRSPRPPVPPSPRPRMRRLYAELHAASAFSFLDGACPPEDLVDEAARLEIPALALGDTTAA